MRIYIRDSYGYQYGIDSNDPDLIGKWFTEHAARLLSVNTQINHPMQMDIWPSEDEKIELKPRTMLNDSAGLGRFIEQLTKLRIEWEAAENRVRP